MAAPIAENLDMADRRTDGRTRQPMSIARNAAIVADLNEAGVMSSTVVRLRALFPGLLYRWRRQLLPELDPLPPLLAEVVVDAGLARVWRPDTFESHHTRTQRLAQSMIATRQMKPCAIAVSVTSPHPVALPAPPSP